MHFYNSEKFIKANIKAGLIMQEFIEKEQRKLRNQIIGIVAATAVLCASILALAIYL